MTAQPQRPAFGTVLTSHMAVATYQNQEWSQSEIKPVGSIDGRTMTAGAPGPVTARIARLYADAVTGESGAHPEWLDYVC